MRNYDRINELPSKGIKEQRAHIIGGGIAGLSAARFWSPTPACRRSGDDLRDLALMGGSMDAFGNATLATPAAANESSKLDGVPLVCLRQSPSMQTPA